ncbi:Uncharacterised protein [Serratia ficaria]|nr:Uncharacterised protein [Serratia ficaria]
MIEKPISQISGLEKPLSASSSAAPGLPGWVTPVTATSAMAITATAPIGIALPMMAMMVPINSASSCQALGATPSGTGMKNQTISVEATAHREGTGLSGVSLSITYPLF